MKVLHLIPSLNLETGGPAKVIVELADALMSTGVRVSVYTTVEKNEDLNTVKCSTPIKAFRRDFLSRVWVCYSRSLLRAVLKDAEEYDVIHSHGIWHYPDFVAYRAAKKTGKPLVLTVHGMLEPWCLSYKSIRKKVYLSLVEKRILRSCAGIQALAPGEAVNIDRIVGKARIFVIPNGIRIEEFDALPPREEGEARYPELKDKKVIVFLGRVDPKKGLDILADAFGELLREQEDAHLVIAGPDAGGYKAKIVRELEKKCALGSTTFTGMVFGRAKLAILSRADVFAHPSYSEGFSMSILEAMACALPVVITKECNFPEVEAARAGIMVTPRPDEVCKALKQLVGDGDLRATMGMNARKLVESKFGVNKVAGEVHKMYAEVVNTRRT